MPLMLINGKKQADNATNMRDKYEYQGKANAGAQAARDDWNKRFGFSYDNGGHDWGVQKMGGDGMGNTYIRNMKDNRSYELGDNGAYRMARQMQNPDPQRYYIKGQGWSLY